MDTSTSSLAYGIYGPLVPTASYHGEIGDDVDDRESLSIYVTSRVDGISHLDLNIAHNLPESSPEYSLWRENLIGDFARFFATVWQLENPQEVDQSIRDTMRQIYETDLRRLLTALPNRFHPVIQQSIDSLPAIFSFPMVLLHRDFGTCNVMVNADDNHLVGVIDWAEAEVGSFGTNLHSLQQFMSKYRLGQGYIRYENYDKLDNIFWATSSFSIEAGGLDAETIRSIKFATVVGLLRSHGFTSRLNNMPEPEPISDDARGAYRMLGLDSLLLAPATKIVHGWIETLAPGNYT